MTEQPRKRITIDPPDGSTILAARHLDATEGRVQVGSTIDTSTRSAITRVLDYIAKAHNSHAAADSADAAAGSYAGRAEEAEARLARVCAEVDRWKLNTLEPQTMRAVSDIGRALDEPGPERAITQPEPWVHIALTSPHPVTANTSALAIADHLTAEFPGVSMQITTNAVEASPSCSPNNPETEPNNSAATEATDIETTARVFAALHRSAEETVTRVTGLYEQWVKAGPPPLGVPMSRWWDRRLVELRAAIRGGAEQPARTTVNNPAAWTPPPPGSDRDKLPDHLLALIRDRMRPYLSTACETATALEAVTPGHPAHADELRRWTEREHASCRLTRKQDMAVCICLCHTGQPEEQQ